MRSGWVPQRRRGTASARSSPAHRPSVNGQPIPLHISDLHSPAFQQHQQQQPSNGAPSPLLPPKKQFDSDLVVVLDMDECLIHAQFLSSPAVARVYAHQLRQQRRQQQSRESSTSTASAVDSFRFTLPDGGLVHVNIRPGLEDFLKKVTERFETHVFTAALPVYANRVLDRLDPDGTRFAGRWFRDSCTYDPPLSGGSGAYVKNLNRLPCTVNQLDRVVLVDNNPLSFLANPSNGILINSFYNDPNDKSLSAVLELIEELDEHEDDVRPILGPKFALEESLQDVARSHQNQIVKAA